MEKPHGCRITQAIADYVAQPLSGGPEQYETVLQIAMMDWLAVTLEGGDEPNSRLIRTLAVNQREAGQCTILSTGERVSPLMAALANATASHTQDFDDIHDYLSLHLESPIISAALAAAEYRNASGDVFAEGILKGMQVMAALGDGILPEHFAVGWHATATLGVFGAAAACGSILGLTGRQMQWAFGLSASCSAGLQANMGTMAKAYQAAHAARQGLEAALLALDGFTANEAIFDSPYLEMLSTKIDREAMLERLSATSAMYELRYKQFPCGIPTHPGIINCASIAAEEQITAQEIERMVYTTFPRGKKLTGNPTPANGLEAKFSIPYCGAVGFLYGTVTNASFLDEAVRDPQVLALMERSVVETDQALNYTRGGRTVIVCRDGRRFVRECHLVGKSVRLEDQQMQVNQKYDSMMIPRFQTHRSDEIKSLIRTLLHLESIDELIGCLRPSQP